MIPMAPGFFRPIQSCWTEDFEDGLPTFGASTGTFAATYPKIVSGQLEWVGFTDGSGATYDCGRVLADSPSLENFDLTFESRYRNSGSYFGFNAACRLIVRNSNMEASPTQANSVTKGVAIEFSGPTDRSTSDYFWVRFFTGAGSSSPLYDGSGVDLDTASLHTFRLVANGGNYKFYIDGALKYDGNPDPSQLYDASKISLFQRRNFNSNAVWWIDNISFCSS